MISRQKGFTRIDKLADVLPGDIIAMKSPPRDPGGTGHVMLVDARPAQRETDTAPLIEGTRQWEVEVIDSSKSPHGRSDTRHNEDGGKRTGLGRGTFRLYADSSGTLVGYAWSVERASKFFGPRDKPIAIDRIVAGNSP